MWKERLWLSASFALMVCLPIVRAEIVQPIVSVKVVGGGLTSDELDASTDSTTVLDNNDGTYALSGTTAMGGWSGVAEFSQGENAAVGLTLMVTNVLDVAATFELVFSVNVSPLLAPTVMSGSINGTITDTSAAADGATISTPLGDAIYRGMIDGVAVRTLSLSPSTQSAPAGGFSDFGPFTFGDEAGPAVDMSIGIRNRFTLSPGDTVNLTSVFRVVPEPASLLLMALGAAVMASRRRGNRRREA